MSTDALELGIDIGALDAAICVTFPGTVASLKQMWGRAGRRGRGLAIYVAGEDALDQFFCRHPDEFLERPVEAAILDPHNEQLFAAHLLCAAHEGPLSYEDEHIFGPEWREAADVLVGNGDLRLRPEGTYVPRRADEYPAGGVSLRSAGMDPVSVIDGGTGEVIGTVDAGPAPSTVHQGAVYLHGGRTFEVAALQLDDRRAFVKPFDGNWYTQPKRETDTQIAEVLATRTASGRAFELRDRGGDRAGARLPAAAPERPRGDGPDPAGSAPDVVRHAGAVVRARETTTSARCTPPSTPRSPSCRCWRCATAGTSAGSRRTTTRRPAGRRSSSTTAIRAGSGSRAAATRRSSGWWATPTGS